jgi:hypothetical protein
MLVTPIGIDLSPDVFVEKSEPFVRHPFDAHDQLVVLLYTWRAQS